MRPLPLIRSLAVSDPGIRPEGIRDRTLRAVLKRGRVDEDWEKTRRSREYWMQRKEVKEDERD
jgi:hypothetical protein